MISESSIDLTAFVFIQKLMDGAEVILVHLHNWQRPVKTIAFNEVHDAVHNIAAIAQIPGEAMLALESKSTVRRRSAVSKMQNSYSTFIEET